MNEVRLKPMRTNQFVGWFLAIGACAITVLLSGCGGAEAGISSNGTGSPVADDQTIALGPITNLDVADGVNAPGVEIAGVLATTQPMTIAIDGVAAKTASDLRLGMGATMRAVKKGGSTAQTLEGVSLVADSLVVAPIQSIQIDAADPSSALIKVFGRDVQVDQNTLFDGFASIGELAVGEGLRVFGLFTSGTTAILATRLQRVNDANRVELFGAVSSIIGTQAFVAGTAVELSGALVSVQVDGVNSGLSASGAAAIAVGNVVRVTSTATAAMPTPTGNSVLPARDAVVMRVSTQPTITIAVDGFIRNYIPGESLSLVGPLVYGGVQINRGALILPSPAPPGGVPPPEVDRARVTGTVVTSSTGSTAVTGLVAAQTARANGYRIAGEVSALEGNGVVRLRGERINVAVAQFVGGSASDIVIGRKLRVTASVAPRAADRSTLIATRVDFL
jgi:hypothetical protein